jgi:hypothetical protein
MPEEAIRASVASLLGKPLGEVTDDQVRQYREPIEAVAATQAEALGAFLDGLAAHLHAIGCKPEEVAAYLHVRRQTLASLYALVSKPNPSPSAVKKLALRFALDARGPIEGNVYRFTWRRTEAGWLIEEYPSVGHRGMPLPQSSRLVSDPFAVMILDRVFAEPPNPFRIMETIEAILHGPPRPGDTLEEAGQPRFDYAFSEVEGQKLVRLWIGDREVPLIGLQDVHTLLTRLCTKPDVRLGGHEAERRLHLGNASRAVKRIRGALKTTLPGAEQWLLTNPICWAVGHAPEFRRTEAGKG